MNALREQVKHSTPPQHYHIDMQCFMMLLLVALEQTLATNLWSAVQPWSKDVSSLPKSASSVAIINALSNAGGFGNARLQIDFSINVMTANSSTTKYPWTRTSDWFAPDCDCGAVPVPVGGSLEGEAGYACTGNGDCHLLVVDKPKNLLYEMWRADATGGLTAMKGGCLAVWNLKANYTNTMRGAQCTSADAAGLPITPLLFNADEVASGIIDHAIRFILPNTRIRRKIYVAPATHSTGATTGGSNLPPYGVRFRLKPTFNLTVLTPSARVIAKAMQKYGMLLADGGTVALTGQNDKFTKAKWSQLGITSMSLVAIKPTDFEVVDFGRPQTWTGNCVRSSGLVAPIGIPSAVCETTTASTQNVLSEPLASSSAPVISIVTVMQTVTLVQATTLLSTLVLSKECSASTANSPVATSTVQSTKESTSPLATSSSEKMSQGTLTSVPTNLPPPPTNNRTPAIPKNVVVIADDRYATLEWDLRVYRDFNMGIQDYAWQLQERLRFYNHAGYHVTWGPVNGPISDLYTPFQRAQLQPLTPGVVYFANVKALHVDGTIYGPTFNVTFTSNSSRVDGLKSSMTAFFDDFNVPAGPMNESNWNIAYSYCNFPMLSAAFINNQFHAHQVISSPSNCEKGLVVARPRSSFDFTGRTGTVVFDFDGAFGASQWYLDLVPGDKVDIEGHIHIADPTNAGAPLNVIRLRTKSQEMQLVFFGQDGIEKILKKVSLDVLGVSLIRNVRRPFVCRISNSLYQVFVSDKLVLSQSVVLPYSVATVHFTLYSYDTVVMDEPFATIHWDNFGFDGPPSSQITRNYVGQSQATFVRFDQYRTPGALSVKITDSVQACVGARVMWTANAYGNILSTDTVQINGQTFAFPIPVEGTLPQSSIMNFESSRAFVIPLTASQIQAWAPGTVGVLFSTTNPVFIQNLHVEVDWSVDNPPTSPFSAPIAWYGALTSLNNAHPVFATSRLLVGNNAFITKVGDKNIGYNEQITSFSDPECVAGVAITGVYGHKVIVQGEVYTDIEIAAYGKAHPIQTIIVKANNVTIGVWNLPGTQTAFRFAVPLDTTLWPAGTDVQIFPHVTSSDGTPGLPNYHLNMGGISCNGVHDGRLGSNTGDYLPIRVQFT